MALHFCITPLRMQNKGPMVSFTFDDFPKSASSVGVPMLDAYNARATFYVAGSLVGKRSEHWAGVSDDEIVELHRRGHEIACHTFSHARTSDLNAAALTAEIENNRRYLLALDPSIKIENFAYPYGTGSVWRKGQLKKTFRSSRGIMPGVNSGVADLQFLRATPLVNRNIDCDGIDRVFDEAVATNGWLIFYSHDVADEPSPYGCTPSLLKHALEAAAVRKIQMLSVADALQAAGA
jgi:peptidoglycan/xylan/chitin deacetylase (PgdA/CDA1 family)